MARSRYIYAIFDIRFACPMALFTVKHEAVSWLERADKSNGQVAFYVIRRTEDNPRLTCNWEVVKLPSKA